MPSIWICLPERSTRLQAGIYLLFYLSGEDKSVVAYAKVKSLSFKQPAEIREERGRTQMDEEKFNEHIRSRESKPLVFLELGKVVLLERPTPVASVVRSPITMAGLYLTADELRLFIGDRG